MPTIWQLLDATSTSVAVIDFPMSMDTEGSAEELLKPPEGALPPSSGVTYVSSFRKINDAHKRPALSPQAGALPVRVRHFQPFCAQALNGVGRESTSGYSCEPRDRPHLPCPDPIP